MVRGGARTRGDDGWSREEEAKLHRAHLLVRATPNFWRDIAKQVPGRSPDECFEKFYSAHPTPPAAAHHPNSRSVDQIPAVKPIGDELLRLSPGRLLHQPEKKRARIRGKSQRAIIKSHKVVREILRKQRCEDQGYEEDAFAELESTEFPASWSSRLGDSTPVRLGKVRKPSRKAAALKELSPASSSRIQSPEVLKRCSNDKRHDRYLDLLIRRNKVVPVSQKRKVAMASPSSSSGGGGKGGAFGRRMKSRLDSSRKQPSTVSDARSAVIAGAREVLQQAAKKRKAHDDDDEELILDDSETEKDEEEDEDCVSD